MLFDKKFINKLEPDVIKTEINALAKFESKLCLDVSKLEEPLKTISIFLAEKEKLEHSRNALIKLLDMASELRKELAETDKRIAILLDHAKIHWPGRDNVKYELLKLNAKGNKLKFALNCIDSAVSNLGSFEEIAEKLILLEKKIVEFGGDRILISINEALKKPAIQRGDLVEIQRRLK
ncbi:MAG: hypothetical protein QW625_00750 [Candidatus Nanoarchaeia archaeon]